MISALLNVPRSIDDWQIWTLAHKTGHDEIRQAIQNQTGILTGDYQLDPINPADIEGWLGRVQQTHVEMNAALGITGSDLEGVDLRDERQLAAWIWLNWQEDNNARVTLGI